VQSGDAANYQVVVANVAGSVTSVVASLTVNVPPTITFPARHARLGGGRQQCDLQPWRRRHRAIYYQWRLNGTNLADGIQIAGAASAALSIAGVQPTNAGGYSWW